MPWFSEYCNSAKRTDRLADNPRHIPLLAAGLYGETGSILAEFKKEERERDAYPAYRKRLVDELGDFLWYFARLVSTLAPEQLAELSGLAECPAPSPDTDSIATALKLGRAVGELLDSLQEENGASTIQHFRRIWDSLARVAAVSQVSLEEAAERNRAKTASRWPDTYVHTPLFDDGYDETEQLPRNLEVEFRQIIQGGEKTVVLRCNDLNFGDRLTDNIADPDYYRFHDIFHFAYAVHLGWSPVIRSLLKCKRKSVRSVDMNQDGARAGIIEEAVSAIVFSRAKEMHFFDGIDHVDYDLLKTIQEFVNGFEVDQVPLWLWEKAILDGYRVFRALRDNGGGYVTLDLTMRELRYRSPM